VSADDDDLVRARVAARFGDEVAHRDGAALEFLVARRVPHRDERLPDVPRGTVELVGEPDVVLGRRDCVHVGAQPLAQLPVLVPERRERAGPRPPRHRDHVPDEQRRRGGRDGEREPDAHARP
jgi:hypothetical protein